MLEFLQNAWNGIPQPGELLGLLYDAWLEIVGISAVVMIAVNVLLYILKRKENNDPISVIEKAFSSLLYFFCYSALIICIGALVIGLSCTRVPNVRNKTLSEAEQILIDHHLSYDLQSGYVKNNDTYKLYVVDQDCDTGCLVRRGKHVTLLFKPGLLADYGDGERGSYKGFVRIDTAEVLKNYVGQSVTVSFDILTENDLTLRYYAYQDSGVSIAGRDNLVIRGSRAYQRVSFTTTVKDWGKKWGLTSGAIGLISQNEGKPNYTIRRIKIEVATK